MTTITYTPALEGLDRKERSIDISDYRRICERRKSIFEKLPDDVPLKLYLDLDLKEKHCNEGHYFEDVSPQLIELAKTHIRAELESLGSKRPPQFAVKIANDIDRKIISFHLICVSHKMTKIQQKVFFENVERRIENDTENNWRRDYIDVKPDTRFVDLSVYGRNRFLRSALSTKPLENRHFEIAEGTFEDTVISYDNHNAEIVEIQIPERVISKSTCVVSGEEAEEINAYLDAGFFVKLAGEYKSWTEMGFAIYGACGQKGYPLFDKFSKLCPLKYDNYQCREWYERLTPRDSGRGMGSIKYLAKLENPVEYKRICKLFQKISTFMSVADITDAFKCAEVIQTTLRQYLIFCKEKWYMLNDDNLWVEHKEPSFYVVREIRKYLDYSNIKHAELIAATEDETIKNKLVKTAEEYLKCYKSISSASYLSVVTKFLKTHLREDTFAAKLDTNAGFLAFKNGIMNLQTGEFRYGIESADFISATIPHDYEPADATKKSYLKSILLQILNNNPEHLEYFLSLIGFTFIGTPHLEKSLYFCVDKTSCGAGDNGKSFFFNILDKLLPNYVHKSKSNLLEESNQKVHKQLAQLKGMRLVWMDEFGKNKTNAELMKVFGDGTSYEYEVMFGTTDILDILFKTFVLTNHLPNIGAEEKAVFNRYTQISYGSHFDRTGDRKESDPENLLFIADPTLTDTILADYANEVFGLIIEYAKSYYVKGIPPIPRQFLQDTQETQNSNDPFVEWFEENMEVVEDGRVGIKTLSYLYGKSVEKTRDAMQRRGFKYNKELKGIGKDESGKLYKGGFEGVRIKTEMV